MLHATSPALFRSTDTAQILDDPVNEDWLAVVHALYGPVWDAFARRYHLALSCFRRRPRRGPAVGQVEIEAAGRAAAEQVLLREVFVDGSRDEGDMFVAPGPEDGEELPPSVADPSVAPPPWAVVLAGPGRPPLDGLCLLRAFLGAAAMGLGDSPTAVHALLHSNPTFARQCGFVGPGARKQPGERTSRALPSLSVCEEFDEVMTRYGLWHAAQLEQVTANIRSGAVELDGVVSFDTTHLEANSGCRSVAPDNDDGSRATRRKVSRLRKWCDCGKDAWRACPHPWWQTDPGAGVVWKSRSRIYWAHKISIAATGRTEVPLSAAVLNYAARHDGKTLLPHLDRLAEELPEILRAASDAVADPAYIGLADAVAERFGLVLRTGIVGRRARAGLAESYPGIDRFTPTGVPVCGAGEAFDFLGRDMTAGRFLWAAPLGPDGEPVCSGCPLAAACLAAGGRRRHLRLRREDFEQIDWDRPQHQGRHRATYALRTGVERAIKRLKIDLGGEHLTRRGAVRVQAHIDRRMLVIHLLLARPPT